MPHVTFENDQLTVEVDSGSSLQLAAKEADSGLEFGCRSGSCGTCVLQVIAGLDSLDEKGWVEEDTLSACGAHDPLHRLGCQLILRDGDIEVLY